MCLVPVYGVPVRCKGSSATSTRRSPMNHCLKEAHPLHDRARALRKFLSKHLGTRSGGFSTMSAKSEGPAKHREAFINPTGGLKVT
jgi:hypothetical protein